MDSEIQTLTSALIALWEDLVRAFSTLFLPSRLNQMLILLGCAAAAYLLKRWTAPKLNDWLRARDGWPMWRLKAGLQVQRRLWLIYVCITDTKIFLAMPLNKHPGDRFLRLLYIIQIADTNGQAIKMRQAGQADNSCRHRNKGGVILVASPGCGPFGRENANHFKRNIADQHILPHRVCAIRK